MTGLKELYLDLKDCKINKDGKKKIYEIIDEIFHTRLKYMDIKINDYDGCCSIF